jgi:hypothetical protein
MYPSVYSLSTTRGYNIRVKCTCEIKEREARSRRTRAWIVPDRDLKSSYEPLGNTYAGFMWINSFFGLQVHSSIIIIVPVDYHQTCGEGNMDPQVWTSFTFHIHVSRLFQSLVDESPTSHVTNNVHFLRKERFDEKSILVPCPNIFVPTFPTVPLNQTLSKEIAMWDYKSTSIHQWENASTMRINEEFLIHPSCTPFEDAFFHPGWSFDLSCYKARVIDSHKDDIFTTSGNYPISAENTWGFTGIQIDGDPITRVCRSDRGSFSKGIARWIFMRNPFFYLRDYY